MHVRTPSMLDDVRPLALGLAGTSLLAAASGAAAADARVTLLVDGAVVAEAVADGASMLNGPVELEGSAADGDWAASWSLMLDADAADAASIDGVLSFENAASSTRSVQFVVELPFCRAVDGPTVVGGTAYLSLVADADGGMLSVPAGSAGVSAGAGASEAAAMFTAPFFVFASGSGVMSTSSDFGLPAPSMAGPDFADGMSLASDFTLSAGDAMDLEVSYALAAEDPADVADCADDRSAPDPDLDGDGRVGIADLLQVIYAWGACADCPADLDGSGHVDFMDMTIILGAWG